MGLEGLINEDMDFEDLEDLGELDELAEEQEIEFDEIKSQTEKAILFKFGNKEAWLPKSQIRIRPGYKSVVIPNWLCFENELI
jgi:hypothetical protein